MSGHVVPLVTAHGTEQNAVGLHAFLKLGGGQGIAVLVDSTAAHIHVCVVEGMAVKLGHTVEDAQSLLHDLGADAVAANYRYIFNHCARLLSGT